MSLKLTHHWRDKSFIPCLIATTSVSIYTSLDTGIPPFIYLRSLVLIRWRWTLASYNLASPERCARLSPTDRARCRLATRFLISLPSQVWPARCSNKWLISTRLLTSCISDPGRIRRRRSGLMHLAVKRSLLQTLFSRPDNGVACSCSYYSVRQDALPLPF